MNIPVDDPRQKIKSVTVNGERMPLEDAKVSIMAPGLTFAATVFEGLRAYWNEEKQELFVFRLDDHLKRLLDSMKLLRLDEHYSVDTLREQLLEDLRSNGYREDTYIRLQSYVDDWGSMTAKGPVSTSIVSYPRPRLDAFRTGRDFAVSSWRRLDDNASPPRAKAAGNYINSRLAGLEAKESGYDGAIILTAAGRVSEGPGGCIFLVRNGVLITPGVTSGILESITRDSILKMAEETSQATEARDVDRTELYIADEIFYCGTGQEITPIISVDRVQAGNGKPGKITQAMQALYDGQVRDIAPEHRDWRTPVYGNQED
jgi:branched-chain amino acid aminotransferase